jgi:threonine synthase
MVGDAHPTLIKEQTNVAKKEFAYQQCINPDCKATFGTDEIIFACPKCGNLLDIRYEWDKLPVPKSLKAFEDRWGTRASAYDFSGVWRFRDLLPFAEEKDIVTIGEGKTILQKADLLASHIGHQKGKLFLQYEGMNPSGSFKDNGMTAAFTLARRLGMKRVACASTGNTSASLAMYAGMSGSMQGIVFIGSGKIAYGKLSQALEYGALTLQVQGDFDTCLKQVRLATDRLGLYLMNSVNPFRLEGQKTIMYRILEARNWQVPDWVIVPGGNMGNSSAFGKAFQELYDLGLINKIPRVAIINAAGANTLYDLFENKGLRWNGGHTDDAAIKAYYDNMDAQNIRAHTIASAIEIGRPVNLKKALRTLEITNGVVREVTDEDIMEHKAMVGRFGFGCEPASAASVAGLHKLLKEQVISPSEDVVCILTGHLLKDPDATVAYHTGLNMKKATPPAAEPLWGKLANKPIQVADDLDAICKVLGEKTPEIDQTTVSQFPLIAPLEMEY